MTQGIALKLEGMGAFPRVILNLNKEMNTTLFLHFYVGNYMQWKKMAIYVH